MINMLNLKLAFKNIFRNKRRTIITLFALVIGNIGILLFLGYMNASFYFMRESIIKGRLSHVQIYKKGYSEKGSIEPNKYMINENIYHKIKELLSKEKMVRLVTPRVSLKGLIASKDQSTIFAGEGVDPDEDSQLSSRLRITDGKELTKESSDGIIAGIGVARSMSAKVGEGLTLMTSTVEGGINAVDVTIQGIMQTGAKEYDDIGLKIPISTAQRLLNTKAVTKIFVLLNDTENVPVFVQKLKDIIKTNKFDLEFKTWDELAEFFHQTVGILQKMFSFVAFIIGIIVIFSIANTLTMSVMERITEIGTIRAIGATKRSILKLFLMEGAIIGIIGGVLGLCFGIIGSYIINNLDFRIMYPGQNTSSPVVIFISISSSVLCFLSSIIISVLSSVLPAIKASRLVIVDAFRHV
jgi:putative ABC transport system permease protein